ncbi:MAG: class I SAM-dependent methyltransferase [Dehalococcoidia bacterium]|nr:class I SAM-dependent methyltransferase [Dehalococcoidia bacterium]
MLYGSKINPADKHNTLTMIVDMVNEGARVLDVGCGVGNKAAFLSGAKKCQVSGIEVLPLMAEMARRYCSQIIVGDIEDASVRQQALVGGPFDYIIFADVLEHLADPWTVLAAMRNALSQDGRVLISVPNVAHWTIRLQLASGKFDYTEGFLLDRTHLRFFTLASARHLIAFCGYKVEKEIVRWSPFPGDRLWRKVPFLRNAVNETIAKIFPGLYGYQFVFCLRKNE